AGEVDRLVGPEDAGISSAPAGTHARLAIEALRRGKHVLVEKPLATSSSDAEALVRCARSAGRVLMVGHTFLYHAAVRALRELIEDGALGRIYYVDSKRVNLGLHRKDVDVLWDLAAHDIAIVRYLLGADPEFAAAHGAAFHHPGVAEVAYVELRYPRDVLATLHVSWLDPGKVRRMTVAGSKAMAGWEDGEPAGKPPPHRRGVARRPYHDDFGQWQAAYRLGEPELVPLDFQEPLRLQAEEFLRAIHDGDRPLTDGEGGLAVVRALEQASRSLRLGARRDA